MSALDEARARREAAALEAAAAARARASAAAADAAALAAADAAALRRRRCPRRGARGDCGGSRQGGEPRVAKGHLDSLRDELRPAEARAVEAEARASRASAEAHRANAAASAALSAGEAFARVSSLSSPMGAHGSPMGRRARLLTAARSPRVLRALAPVWPTDQERRGQRQRARSGPRPSSCWQRLVASWRQCSSPWRPPGSGRCCEHAVPQLSHTAGVSGGESCSPTPPTMPKLS